jgi:ribosome-binding protein aMBF1 (putative translation factor)
MLRLTLEREKLKLTKTSLGAEVGLHPAVIGKLEAGKIYAYKPWKEKLSNFFEIPDEELFKEV